MTIAPQPDPNKQSPGGAPGLALPTEETPVAFSPDLFGTSLEPALIQACNGRLSAIRWFRTDWQRGGAVTGFATWRDPQDHEHAVLVKLPVPPQELRWLDRLQVEEPDVPVVPRLFASGVELGGYDLAWVVMERLDFGPLDGTWDGAEFDLLIEAAARFHAAAAEFPIDREPPEENWPQLLDRARKALRDVALPDSQRWNTLLKALKKKLKPMLQHWHARETTTWCHGDLHLANAMTRTPAPAGPAILFDLARVHVGHWIEDAVYFEHLFWSVPQRVNGRDLVKTLAQHRKASGLPVEPDWPRLANIRRVLLAIGNLAAQGRRPDPVQAAAALATVDRLLPQL